MDKKLKARVLKLWLFFVFESEVKVLLNTLLIEITSEFCA